MPPLPARRHLDEAQSDPPAVRVLVVDDDPDFRRWIATLLGRSGLSVELAADGLEALEHLGNAGFDLVIADLEMPKMDGLTLIRRIRATPQLAHQYAVMLTSHEDVDSKVAALTVGYDDFMAKSSGEAEVVAKVLAAKRMLARNRMLSAAASEWQSIASRDELTGVASRRSLIESAAQALGKGRAIGIAILDLDDFKPVNDTFGHLTGDRILRDIGALFIHRTRSNELIARYGGDEFVLLTCDLPLDDVVGAAHRLVAEIEALRWTSGDATFAIRVTAGVAHSSLIEGPTFERLLDVADRDLYARKWIKKNPGMSPDLYDYERSSPGRVISLDSTPAPADRSRNAREKN